MGSAGGMGGSGSATYRLMPNRFSKLDYEMFAHVLKNQKPPTTADNKDPANLTWAAMVEAIAALFKEDNPRFDHLTFMTRIHEHEVLLEPAAPPTQATS